MEHPLQQLTLAVPLQLHAWYLMQVAALLKDPCRWSDRCFGQLLGAHRSCVGLRLHRDAVLELRLAHQGCSTFDLMLMAVCHPESCVPVGSIGWLSCFQAEAQRRITFATNVALAQCDPCQYLVRPCKYITGRPAILWVHLLAKLADVAATLA